MYAALMTALVVFIGTGGHEFFGNAMLSRPIVVAPLLGLLLGDLKTGLLVGASVETIFMGVVNIGVSSTAEPALAAALSTVFTIQSGNMGANIAIAFPLAVLGLQLLNMILSFVIGPFAPLFSKYAKKGEDKKMVGLHFGLWFLHYGLYALIPFFAVLFGSKAVQYTLNAIPKNIMNGLTVAGNLLPAVGMAMLLLMLWDKKLAVYYFLGVVLMAYFKLPLIAIAAIAAILAVITAQRDISQRKSNVQTNNATENVDQSSSNLSQEEEDFFK
jgi:PTS system mannose-specific IIC component